MDDFDEISVGDLLEEAQTVALLAIPSPTLHKAYNQKVARRLLGSELTDEVESKIQEELEANITNEKFQPVDEQNAQDQGDSAQKDDTEGTVEKKDVGDASDS